MIANEPAQSNSRGGKRWQPRGRDVLAVGVLWSMRFLGEFRALLSVDDGSARLSATLSGEELGLHRQRWRP